jgi:hypothetical protein
MRPSFLWYFLFWFAFDWFQLVSIALISSHAHQNSFYDLVLLEPLVNHRVNHATFEELEFVLKSLFIKKSCSTEVSLRYYYVNVYLFRGSCREYNTNNIRFLYMMLVDHWTPLMGAWRACCQKVFVKKWFAN